MRQWNVRLYRQERFFHYEGRSRFAEICTRDSTYISKEMLSSAYFAQGIANSKFRRRTVNSLIGLITAKDNVRFANSYTNRAVFILTSNRGNWSGVYDWSYMTTDEFEVVLDILGVPDTDRPDVDWKIGREPKVKVQWQKVGF